MDTVGFIGAGNMAEAFIKGIIASGMQKPETIIAADIRPERLEFLERKYGIKTTTDNVELVSASSTVFLSVKPQIMAAVAEGIAGALKDDALVISIAAGITTDFLAAKLGEVPIIRVMPNTPAMAGEGMSAIYNRNAGDEALQRAEKLLGAVGKTVVVENEDIIDAVTAVSGSGPAYFFLLMEEMTAAAIALGIDEESAKLLVCQTAKGAGTLAMIARENNESPEVLRKKVTSPGGTTAAALAVFQEKGFGAMVTEAVKRARDRSKELSAGA
ncbi:MAG: pyrroline-5-carboxylate reductase [Spirochaetales bacterium]|nr:pyrroline-5-carboxylate reductase [Spirochaetales bacterium]